jgi:hypothetical protein
LAGRREQSEDKGYDWSEDDTHPIPKLNGRAAVLCNPPDRKVARRTKRTPRRALAAATEQRCNRTQQKHLLQIDALQRTNDHRRGPPVLSRELYRDGVGNSDYANAFIGAFTPEAIADMTKRWTLPVMSFARPASLMMRP